MNKELTEIVMVIDRSGSMDSIKTEAQGGINAFIDDQKQTRGKANLTLVQFDTEHETIFDAVNIDQVGEYSLEPRGCTALLDAVGMAITKTGTRLDAMEEDDKPGLVVFVIVTDGRENSSKEYRLESVKGMIEEQTNKYNWKFIYLGSDVSTFDDAHKMGIGSGLTSSYSGQNIKAAYCATSNMVRTARNDIADGLDAAMEFSDEDREEMA